MFASAPNRQSRQRTRRGLLRPHRSLHYLITRVASIFSRANWVEGSHPRGLMQGSRDKCKRIPSIRGDGIPSKETQGGGSVPTASKGILLLGQRAPQSSISELLQKATLQVNNYLLVAKNGPVKGADGGILNKRIICETGQDELMGYVVIGIEGTRVIASQIGKEQT